MRKLIGASDTNSFAAVTAAANRVGATSVASIEPDTSIASITIASLRGTSTLCAGRARPTTSEEMATSSAPATRWRRQPAHLGDTAAPRRTSGWRTARRRRVRCSATYAATSAATPRKNQSLSGERRVIGFVLSSSQHPGRGGHGDDRGADERDECEAEEGAG